MRTPSSSACKRCAAAKRRCGRQKPQCVRCQRLNSSCTYPSPAPGSFVLLSNDGDDEVGSVSSATATTHGSHPSTTTASTASTTASTALTPGLDATHNPSSDTVPWLDDVSALFPEPRPDLDASAFDNMRTHLAGLLAWVARWVDEGSNPIIHPQLYRRRMPACVQDAYTTAAAYLRRNAANERIVLRIVEDRARRLVEDNSHASSSSSSSFSLSNDPIAAVGRVQALLVYQIIGLLDGDARLRHVAEGHAATLGAWAAGLEPLARYPLRLGDPGGTPGLHVPSSGVYEGAASSGARGGHGHGCGDGEWMSWVVAESMHRTWTIVSGALGMYAMVRGGASRACSVVGMMQTARRQAWDAPSAPAWEGVCAGADIGLIFLSEIESLFDRFHYDDVDEFAVMNLGVMFGAERVERWRLRPSCG